MNHDPFTESTAAGRGTQEVFILVFLTTNLHVHARQNQEHAIKRSAVFLKTVRSAVEKCLALGSSWRQSVAAVFARLNLMTRYLTEIKQAGLDYEWVFLDC